jgi:glutamyl-Q tRNA(Asp) synthetase
MMQLKAHGLDWDGEVLFQSSRLEAYEEALSHLSGIHRTFACDCPRKTLPPVYPGTCRTRNLPAQIGESAIRFLTSRDIISFEDRVFGTQRWQMEVEVGDFIIRRRDGLTAYQLAVVVDDNFQGITHVVRGADLLDSTPRQLALYDAFEFKPPSYLHIPVLIGSDGMKLSKQTRAKPIGLEDCLQTIRQALRDLGQVPQDAATETRLLLSRAAAAWDPRRIPLHLEISSPQGF